MNINCAPLHNIKIMTETLDWVSASKIFSRIYNEYYVFGNLSLNKNIVKLMWKTFIGNF